MIDRFLDFAKKIAGVLFGVVFAGFLWYGLIGVYPRSLLDVPISAITAGEIGYLLTCAAVIALLWSK